MDGAGDRHAAVEEFSGMELPPLLKQIKTILDEYPDDGQIIKELVQNADDAGASQMAIMYDGRTINRPEPNEKEYRRFFRAPAMVFYNNAVFTERDWRGIKMVYNSVKVDDLLQIGRFGLGFKSVFHLTDFPCIVSGVNLLLLNPHETEFGHVCVTIKLKLLRQSSRLDIDDFLESLRGMFGFTDEILDTGHYNGTLFWFPLRTEPSELSDNVYNEDKVMDLLKSFTSDSKRSVLFLKSIQKIHLYSNVCELDLKEERNINSTKKTNTGPNDELFCVEIDNKDSTLLEKKRNFVDMLKKIGKSVPRDPVYSSIDVTVKTRLKRKQSKDEVSKSRWLIVNYLKGGEMSDRLKLLVEDASLSYHPLVGVAAPIHENCAYNHTDGHVFCFQPLPQEKHSLSGLPVHVNAFFALSQNRRHVKWPSDDQVRLQMHTDKAVDWNLALVGEVLPSACAKLFECLIELSRMENNPRHLILAAYNMVPDLSSVNDRWRILAEEFIKMIISQKMLFTENRKGRWVGIDEAVVTLSKGYLKANEERCMDTIVTLIENNDVNLTQVPKSVLQAILFTKCRMTELTPQFLAEHLKQYETYKRVSLDEKENLFEYLCTGSNVDHIADLELLPLQDGTFASFRRGNAVFLDKLDVINLFPGEEERFVSAQIREHSYRLLSGLAHACHYQMRIVDCNSVIELIKLTLRNNFGPDLVVTVSQAITPVWKKWIQAIWEYIEVKFTRDVSKFCDLPLFPITKKKSSWNRAKSFQLNPLTDLLLLRSHKSYQLNEDVCKSFELFSVTIVENIPEWMPLDLVQPYLHDGSSESIARIIEHIDVSRVDAFNDQSSEKQRNALVSFMSGKLTGDISEKATYLLCKLLLFKEYTAINSEPRWISIDDNNSMFDENEFPVRFPTPKLMVHSTDEKMSLEKMLVRNLGGRLCSQLDMVLETMKNIDRYTDDEKKMFMYWFLKQRLYKDNKEATEMAKEIRFLEADDKQMHRPNELFDPSDDLLLHLFRGEPVVPSDLVFDLEMADYLPGLRTLGLKSRKDITPAEIENTCHIIHKMSTGTMPLDQLKTNALLEVLEGNVSLLRQCSLHDLKCIIVQQDRTESYPAHLPYYNKNAGVTLCAPSEIKSSKYTNLIGSVVPVIDCRSFGELAEHFEWIAEPDTRTVVKHLAVVIDSYANKYKSSFLPVITKIYEWLSCREIKEVKMALLKSMGTLNARYIWIGDRFVSASNVVVESSSDGIDLKPFLNTLPPELHHLKDFFMDLGCVSQITMDTYIDTIEKIKIIAEKNENFGVSTLKMRHLVIDILNQLKEGFSKHLSDSDRIIYFPVHTGDDMILKLKPAKQCTFCDSQWLKDVDYIEEEDGIIYVHGDVSNATAEALGVPSLTQQILSDAEALEEWGQQEPLTRRLNSLLKEGYVDGFTVPKELFQNADDAGASKLWIMYDERENMDARSQLLNEGMSECQGPALWVYNDAEFTDEDLKNITRLNGATKEADSSKIGKFGLGFCSVYNITDVPSFISRENIVIFDPHTTFLGKALPGKSPGLKLNLLKMKNLRIMRKVSNQFKPFENVFGCKLRADSEPYFKGTLFRFPLRVRSSDISDVIYTPKEVKKLMKQIIDMSANMFIFNQSVTELRLFHLPRNELNPSNASLLFEVNKTAKRLQSIDASFSIKTSVLKEVTTRKRTKKLKDNPIRVVDEVSIAKTVFSSPHFIDMKETKAFNTSWFVTWATGTDKKSLQLTYAERGAIPIGAIAIPLNKSSECPAQYCPMPIRDLPNGFYDTSHLFCFMPLPVFCAFPFHINGPFAVSSDRRQLRATTEDDKSTRLREWNECLLSDSVVMALLYMLENIGKLALSSRYMFYDLWPVTDTAPLTSLVPQSFYRNILRPGVHRVFENNGCWFDISRCIFLDQDLRQKQDIGLFAFEVLQQFSTDKTAIDIPKKYYNILVQTDQDIMKEKTIQTKEFLINYFLPNLLILGEDKGKLKNRNKLLNFSICQVIPEVDKWLKEHACIPTKNNGVLRMPSEVVQDDSEVASLYSVLDGRFIISELNNVETNRRLCELGMVHDRLTHDQVLDRAKSIKALNQKCLVCSLERCRYLLLYLSRTISSHVAVVNDIKKIPFLPVMRKPEIWPFAWEADNVVYVCKNKKKTCKIHKKNFEEYYEFEKPSQLFDNSCQNLVGGLFLVLENHEKIKNPAIPSNKLEKLLQKLGVSGADSIEVEIVTKQLESFVCTYSPEVTMPTHVLKNVYRHLNQCCLNKDIAKRVLKELRSKKIVWVRNRFTSISNVSIRQDFSPYLCGLRSQGSPMVGFESLCKALNIQNSFEPKCIALVLQDMFVKYGNNPLEQSDLKISLRLLIKLHENMEEREMTMEHLVDTDLRAIYAPSDQDVLHNTKQMCFNDFDSLRSTESMIFVHRDVSVGVAKTFGVNPKLLHNLENSSDDIDDDDEDFYQNEPLVTRLHGLLDGYPCDSGIFKELLQNADDAGATEIHFLNDITTHSTEHILSECFEPLQGPALCVFDNSGFTQKNLKGIQKLGKGSKSDDPSQTGQYGVGFNAVYNLTDAPSFLTKHSEIEDGETMCIFDPMAKYVPKTVKSKPGKRYRNVNVIRAYHRDVMDGYHEHHFFRDGRGTVFRFPLRTKAMAEKSEIKNSPITSEFVQSMLNELGDSLHEMLLFLKNLKKVTISTYTKFNYTENYRVHIKLSQTDNQKRNEFFEHYNSLCEKFSSNRNSSFEVPQTCVDYEMSFMGKHRLLKKYIIVQSIGYDNVTMVPEIVMQHVRNKQLGLLPQGGVAVLLSDSDSTSTRQEGNDDNDTEPKKSKAFCFLPLPIETGLPVHVHGHFALDHETRRTLWKSEKDSSCHKTQWNRSLIRNVIVPAYAMLLKRMKQTILGRYEKKEMADTVVLPALQRFENMFPTSKFATDFYWIYLSRCLYQHLVEGNTAFLPVICRLSVNIELSWTSVKIPNCIYPAYHHCDVSHESSTSLISTLRGAGMRIVCIGEQIRHSLTDAKVCLENLSPRNVIDYFCSYNKDGIGKCSIETGRDVVQTTLDSVYNAQKVMEYCLKEEKYFFTNIRQLPLLVAQDNTLRRIETNESMFVTEYNDFFPYEHKFFLHRCLVKAIDKKDFSRLSQNTLKEFTLENFISFLELSELKFLKDKSKIDWNEQKPKPAWIKKVWKFIWEQNETIKGTEPLVDKLSHWALLPVTESNTSVSKGPVQLVMVKERNNLIDRNSFKGKIKDALAKLCRLQLHEACFYKQQRQKEDELKVYSKMVTVIPNYSTPDKILDCLSANVKKYNTQNANLTQDEASTVLGYLTDNLDAIKQTTGNRNKQTEVKTKIRNLPVFATHYEKVVCLSINAQEYIVPACIPNIGLEGLSRCTNIVLLKAGYIQKDMRQFLAIPEPSVVDIYTKCIIPVQSKMDRTSFYQHIRFLARFEKSETKRMLNCLSEVQFIETKCGMKKVKELFDPNNEVFKVMCKEEELLPKVLNEDAYGFFFKLLGLKYKVTMQLYIRFAKEIAEEGKHVGLTPKIRERSKLVATSFLKTTDMLLKEEFGIFKRIEFIVPRKAADHLTQIHNQLNSERLICFAESVVDIQIDVCWTSTNILPKWACPNIGSAKNNQTVMQKLAICKRPKFELFVKHCKNVGDSLADNEKLLKLKSNTEFAKDVRHAMECIYKMFEELHADGAITDSLSQLESTPIIFFPDKKILVTANCVVNSCQEHEQIPPYVQMSPRHYGQFSDVFILLGGSKEPSCKTYTTVLQMLKQNCGDRELLPPEAHVAQCAIYNLLIQLGKVTAEKIKSQVSALCLLNGENLLHDAKQIVVCDNMYFKKRLGDIAKINFFIGFERLNLKETIFIREDEAIERLKKLPVKSRPVMLTEIVGEKVELPDDMPVTNDRLSYELMTFLQGSRLINGIIRLAKHSLKMKNRPWKAETDMKIRSSMKNIRVKKVVGMKTVLTLRNFRNGSFGPYLEVKNTSEQKVVHIDNERATTWLYFETLDRTNWFDSVKNALAIYINNCLDKCLENEQLFLLSEILNMKDITESIQEVLDKQNIDQYNMDTEEASTSFPKPGTYVPTKYHPFLDNGYGLICEYDYKFIAYEVDDPSMEVDGMETDSTPTYIFCQIIGPVQPVSALPLFQSYEVDIGEETFIIVPAYKLYRFTRKKSNVHVSEGLELVLFQGPSTSTAEEPPKTEETKTLKEVRKEIREILTEAWKKVEEERKYIVKRLMLKWHPDKNPDKVDFCTKVFQYIQQCLRRLEDNKSLSDDTDSEDEGSRNKDGNKKRGQRRPGGSGDKQPPDSNPNWYEEMFSRFHERFRRQPRKEESYQFGEREPFREWEPYHFHEEARRWQRQAKSDFENASDSMNEMSHPSYNWVCYKYHQAAEKSLKAAWYSKDANKVSAIKSSHSLSILALGLCLELQDLVRQLSSVIGEPRRMRYPEVFSRHTIPADLYTREAAQTAHFLTQQMLYIVSKTYSC